jgi:hypothetical protein
MHTPHHPATMHARAPGDGLVLDWSVRLGWAMSVDVATDAFRNWPARLAASHGGARDGVSEASHSW